ncbi:MAG: GNAT family N-acetyltransferase [Kiritimatiellae bacterium]|nr:GNAT family N-acetyltransferase [Kiritimatiellia bacterium]
MNNLTSLVIRQMTMADITLGMMLKDIAHWNQKEADWRALFNYNPGGCFVAEWNGKPVGTITTTVYDDKVGWIGMVLVHPDVRGQGIGTALLKHAIAYLQRRGVPSIKLDATPAGKMVYIPLGFQDEYELERVEAVAVGGNTNHESRIVNLDVDKILNMDRETFGVTREPVLRRLVNEFPGMSWQATKPEIQNPEGYLLARSGANAYSIGPWVARSVETAELLLCACLDKLAGQRVFIDVPVNHPAYAMVARYGFKTQRPLTRMWLGCNDWPGNIAQTYGVADPAKG